MALHINLHLSGDLHIHQHSHGDDKLFTEIKSINQKLNTMGQVNDEIKSLLTDIDASTNNIAADLERIANNAEGGLTAEEATTVVSDLRAKAERLRSIAAINPETGEPNTGGEPGPGDNDGTTTSPTL
jgi:hypothetical protein